MYSVASGPITHDDPGSGGNCTVTEADKFVTVEVNETRSGIAGPGCRYSALTVYVPIGMFPIELLTQSPAIALNELPALVDQGSVGNKVHPNLISIQAHVEHSAQARTEVRACRMIVHLSRHHTGQLPGEVTNRCIGAGKAMAVVHRKR